MNGYLRLETYQYLNYQLFDGKGNLITLVDNLNSITYTHTYDALESDAWGQQYLCERDTGISNEAVGQLFEGVHYSAASRAVARVREEIIKDKELSKLMENLNSHFKA